MSISSLSAFVDLSGLDARATRAAIDALARPDRLGAMIANALVYAPGGGGGPAGWNHVHGGDAVQACAWAFDRAACGATQSLLIVGGGAVPSSDAVGALAEALAIDPLFGAAIPRVSDGNGRVQLFDRFSSSEQTAPRRLLGALPEYRIIEDSLAPCLLVRSELVANLSFVPLNGVWASLADFLLRARRAGYRPVLCNRVVVAVPAGPAAPWGCTAAEVASVMAARGEGHVILQPADRATRADRLLGHALDAPRSLLLDARNLTPTHNGTSAAILGACDGLHRARPDRDVTFWLHPDAAAAHGVRARFEHWTISTSVPSDTFAAAFRLSQPWHPLELDALRDLASVNAFWMLDSIAWDIGYAAPAGLDETWQRLAEEADALLFISEFSLERFRNRFCVSPDVSLAACPLSLDARDYAGPIGNGPEPPYWFVIGNRYDHKHVAPTVDLLARAFPTRQLVVVGDRAQPRSARVTRFTSGDISHDIVRACFGRADAIVFPSFYEGFGLPMIEGLAAGRTVVARESALVHELAARYQGPGQLFTYTSDADLVHCLSRLQRGEIDGCVPLGTAASMPWNWDASAACMLAHIDRLVAAAPSRQMLRRSGLARGLSHPQRQATPAAIR